MTKQESQILQQLLSQLAQTRGVVKDPEAEAMINSALADQPDAAYLLVQRALILQQALEEALTRVAELEDASPPPHAGFLRANAWGKDMRVHESAAIDARATAAARRHRRRLGHGFLRRAGGADNRGGGKVLATLAATAAAVTGGAFLFHSIGNLWGAMHSSQASTSPEGDESFSGPRVERYDDSGLLQEDMAYRGSARAAFGGDHFEV